MLMPASHYRDSANPASAAGGCWFPMQLDTSLVAPAAAPTRCS